MMGRTAAVWSANVMSAVLLRASLPTTTKSSSRPRTTVIAPGSKTAPGELYGSIGVACERRTAQAAELSSRFSV
jgi:hypothetical protein